MSKKELASTADVIVQGTVSSVEPSKWNTPDGSEPQSIAKNDIIYHDVLVHVDKAYKGAVSPNQMIRVRLYGGEVQTGKIKKYEEEGQATLVPKEKVIIFLDYDISEFKKTKSKDYFTIKGLHQGKWSIANDKASNIKETVNTVDLLNAIEQYKNYQWPKPVDSAHREK